MPNYFYISPSVDYTASADDADYIRINYTISNTAGANENASYTIICLNGSSMEVGRKTSTSATTGFFYVPVTNPSKTITLINYKYDEDVLYYLLMNCYSDINTHPLVQYRSLILASSNPVEIVLRPS